MPTSDQSTYKDLTIAVDAGYGLTHDALVTVLDADGIDTRRYFDPPVHRQQSHAGTGANLPVTDAVATSVVSLPLHVGMTAGDAARVVAVITAANAHAEEIRTRSSA